MTSIIDKPSVPTPARAPQPPSLQRFASRRFYACVLILVTAAVGLRSALAFLNYHIRKEGIALKKPLSQADWTRLGPRYKLHDFQPPAVPEETLETLGTREYLQWRIVDTQTPPDRQTHEALVVVTYYTGKPDLVPHVPEECLSAGGYDLIAGPDEHWLAVRGVGAPKDMLPVRLSVFQPPRVGLAGSADAGGVAVMYLFHTNGSYCTTRLQVRAKMMNPLERYAYFAKIEVRFADAMKRPASEEESLAAAAPLLEKLLPILLADHFAWDERYAAGKVDAG